MASTSFGPVLTVSATYGAGGSVIAPRLAREMGIPFIDRVLNDDASEAAGSKEHLTEGEQAATPTGRFLSYFARAASVGAMMAPDPMFDDDDEIRRRTELPLKEVAAGQPAVVLGRAGAVVLTKRPRAFHIRLDAKVERRIEWAAIHESLDRDSTVRRQTEADKARTAFVKRLYRTDPADPSLYHLVIDPTAFGVDPTVEIILGAARAFFTANP